MSDLRVFNLHFNFAKLIFEFGHTFLTKLTLINSFQITSHYCIRSYIIRQRRTLASRSGEFVGLIFFLIWDWVVILENDLSLGVFDDSAVIVC